MAHFVAHLRFNEIKLVPPPMLTDLLFYNTETQKLARGWIDENGGLALIGAHWTPTHYAEHFFPVSTAEARATQLLKQADIKPTPLNFRSVPERFLVVQRNSKTQESEVVAAHNSEQSAREAWANWTVQPQDNCWYEFVWNTKGQ